jgi:hypothetical protein
MILKELVLPLSCRPGKRPVMKAHVLSGIGDTNNHEDRSFRRNTSELTLQRSSGNTDFVAMAGGCE